MRTEEKLNSIQLEELVQNQSQLLPPSQKAGAKKTEGEIPPSVIETEVKLEPEKVKGEVIKKVQDRMKINGFEKLMRQRSSVREDTEVEKEQGSADREQEKKRIEKKAKKLKKGQLSVKEMKEWVRKKKGPDKDS